MTTIHHQTPEPSEIEPQALSDQILTLLRNLPRQQQDALFRTAKQERKPAKSALAS